MKARVGSSAGPHTEGIRNYLGHDGLEELARFGVRVQPFSVARRTVRRSPRFTSEITGPSYHLVARGGGPGTLERQLLQQALDAGATVRFKAKVRPEEVSILATGAPRDQVNIVAAGYRFSREGSNLTDEEIHALFDNTIAPRGYLCVLPGPVWQSIYSCAWGSIEYNELLRKVDAALQLDWVRNLVGAAKLVGKIYGKGYYADDPYSTASQPGPLRVGEAGGIQDAVGGYGIQFAVASGHLAARSLLEGAPYVELLRKEFGEAFEISRRGRGWLDRATNDDYDAFLKKLGPTGTLEDYSKWRESRFF